MNTYALARFVASVNSVDSRKHLQKCLYLIQAVGCDLEAEYELLLYGPYSKDVAGATDFLEAQEVLYEHAIPNGCGGVAFSYRITDLGKKLLDKFERSPEGIAELRKIEPHIPLFKSLNTEDPFSLELAATIVFFQSLGDLEWGEAKAKTSRFKREPEDDRAMQQAEQLARETVGSSS